MDSKTLLRVRQNMPLEIKITLSQIRIRQWNDHWLGQTCISFSGGKDSTVLLHLVRELYPDTPAVFADTGLEYPEIREFVKTIPNVTWVKPKHTFKDVIEKYGYPVISKRTARMICDCQNPTERNVASRNLYLTGIRMDGQKGAFKIAKKWRKLIDSNFKVSDKCCDVIKKYPMHKYQKETGRKPYIGTMASDSMRRRMTYLKKGCNSFDGMISSQPMAFWLEKDIWEYIRTKNLPYSKIYDTGVRRTGCMFCMFGVHLEQHPNRFELMAKTHPQLWDYCINKLGCGKVMDYIGVEYGLKPSKEVK